MNKEKFEYFWKVGVLIILLFSMVYLGFQLRDFTVEGKICLENPYLYAENNTDKYGYPSDYCSFQRMNSLKEQPSILWSID